MKKIIGIGNALTDVLYQLSDNQILNEFLLPLGSMHLVDDEFSSQLKKYKDEFLMGYSVEYYDKKLQECKSIIKESVKYDVRREILKGYRYDGVDYLDIKSNYVGCKYSRIILPTYRITYKSGSREYKSYMNGQTGKVGGYIPRSIFKIFMLVFGISAGISLIAYLFMK